MLDIKLLREKLDEIAALLARRGFILDKKLFLELDGERKELQVKTQELQNLRNTQAKKIGQAKARGENIELLLKQTEDLSADLKNTENQLENILSRLNLYLSSIPNILDSAVPDGKDENFNQEIRRWGNIRAFDFTPKDHVELGEKLGQLDFANAAKITGARFVIMRDKIARLHRALIQFMLHIHTEENHYTELNVPYIVNSDSLYGTGQLPKFADDLFKLQGEQNYFLIPTAEIPITNMARDVIFEAKELPLKFTSHTPCFRSEAGSYGKDTRGMIRQHQFEKVELVHLVKPEDSEQAHEELTQNAEKILQKLNLPYRVVILCAGDTGFSAAKTYDLEVWLPGQQKYREISSCSNMRDFQARRMQARYRNPETNKPELIHTLNGSGLAVGRTLVAIMENYQTADGQIEIPEALWPWMGGIKII